MVVTLSNDEVSNHESESDQEGNFMAFTATAIVSETETVDEKPSDGEPFENDDLQEAYNKLCKIAAKDAIRFFMFFSFYFKQKQKTKKKKIYIIHLQDV